uniref:ribosomal protein L28 n=1 Tax=Rhodella violacea TaxID=2801 RepID=UPI001FCE04A2|nr:ribosomal protein L28 [Rhodella violacea]UNJ18100.1 ribosomal protein L28 [Rhodella violacea]
MAKKCSITGKIANNGYSVSRSHVRNKKIQNVNLQTKKIWDEKTNRFVKVRLSTKAIKTLLKKSSQL